PLQIPMILGLLAVAAVAGDAVNYAIGRRVGPKVFTSETSRLLNKEHLLRTHAFYEKYGGKTIILARFMPIIRTFAPFVAGIGQMGYPRFALYNGAGGPPASGRRSRVHQCLPPPPLCMPPLNEWPNPPPPNDPPWLPPPNAAPPRLRPTLWCAIDGAGAAIRLGPADDRIWGAACGRP